MKNLIPRSALALLTSALLATPVAAGTWYILPDGTGDAPTIQAGLDACAEGDMILVEQHAPGPLANGTGQYGYLPMEFWKDCSDAIEL